MAETQTVSTGSNINKKGFKKIMSLIVLSIVVLGAAATGLWWWRDLQTSISTDDAAVTGDIIDVSPKIAGRLEKLYVSEGAYVQAGQKIATLDNAQYSIALAQAEAGLNLARANHAKLPDDITSAQANVDKTRGSLNAAQAQVKAAEIALDDAKRILGINEALYAGGAISKETIDASRNSWEKAQANLENARANVQAAEASLQENLAKLNSINKTGADSYSAQLQQAQALYDNAKLTYDNSFIYAPKSGTVVRIPVHEGENLTSGQTILSIVDFDKTLVTANVEENKFSRINVGQKVDIKIDAYPGKFFNGEVIEVGGATQSTFSLLPTQNSSGNFTKVTQRLPLKINVDKKDLLFKPGMSAAVKIHTAT
jgi:membrane fusion protein (multidrug efflux system)